MYRVSSHVSTRDLGNTLRLGQLLRELAGSVFLSFVFVFVFLLSLTVRSRPIAVVEVQTRQPGVGIHTGSSALLLPPARISKPRWIYGPITGMFPAN